VHEQNNIQVKNLSIPYKSRTPPNFARNQSAVAYIYDDAYNTKSTKGRKPVNKIIIVKGSCCKKDSFKVSFTSTTQFMIHSSLAHRRNIRGGTRK